MAHYNDLTFSSGFKTHMSDLISIKKSLGFKYELHSFVLKRFDDFCLLNYTQAVDLSREIVDAWVSFCARTNRKTLRQPVTPISQLGQYMCSLGLNAYVFPMSTLPRERRYTPHIYSDDELRRFFAQTDKCRAKAHYPLYPHIMSLLFRLIYCCGLRVSEAISLRTCDVDLQNGVLTVTDSKKPVQRFVPMSEEMMLRCKKYAEFVHGSGTQYCFFFPSSPESPLNYDTVYGNFRNILLRAGITHGGRKHPVRIHDFRHTFAVNCLKRWVVEEKDIHALYPYLSAYMGHLHFQDTVYYFHLTADVYPFITQRLEQCLKSIVPNADWGDDDE